MNTSNYATAQSSSHQQRQVIRLRPAPGGKSLTEKAIADFMRWRSKARDPEDRAYLDTQLQRLGVPWVVQR